MNSEGSHCRGHCLISRYFLRRQLISFFKVTKYRNNIHLGKGAIQSFHLLILDFSAVLKL